MVLSPSLSHSIISALLLSHARSSLLLYMRSLHWNLSERPANWTWVRDPIPPLMGVILKIQGAKWKHHYNIRTKRMFMPNFFLLEIYIWKIPQLDDTLSLILTYIHANRMVFTILIINAYFEYNFMLWVLLACFDVDRNSRIEQLLD